VARRISWDLICEFEPRPTQAHYATRAELFQKLGPQLHWQPSPTLKSKGVNFLEPIRWLDTRYSGHVSLSKLDLQFYLDSNAHPMTGCCGNACLRLASWILKMTFRRIDALMEFERNTAVKPGGQCPYYVSDPSRAGLRSSCGKLRRCSS
jgi:hypothetical protein